MSLSKRFVAKIFDYIVCFSALSFGTFLTPFDIAPLFYLYLLVATPVVWILPETLLLKIWKETPGSSLVCIRPHGSNPSSLSWVESLKIALLIDTPPAITWSSSKKNILHLLLGIGISAVLVIGASLGKAFIQFPKEFEKKIFNRGWVQYTSSDNDFTAEFPSEPRAEQKQLEIPQARRTIDYIEVKTDHKDQVTYSISSIEIPKKWTIFGSRSVLKGALSVLTDALSFDAKILSQTITSHRGHPAINFEIRDGGLDIKGRLVLVGTKLFNVQFAQPYDTTAEEVGISFLDSFEPISHNNP